MFNIVHHVRVQGITRTIPRERHLKITNVDTDHRIVRILRQILMNQQLNIEGNFTNFW